MEYLQRPTIALVAAIFLLWIVYLVSLAVYRLYLHPLANFPGPKLAALTKWYEFYHEVILKGQFTFHIQSLHREYGPIVRITPFELHVEDPDYWDELYSRANRHDKYEWMSRRFGNSNSVFTTAKHDLHAIRRGALNPMFSKRSVLNFQPEIREKVEILCGNIAEYRDTGRVLSLGDAWSAFAGDVMAEYMFGMCYNHLESPDFKENFQEAFMAVCEFGHIALQFPWVHPVLNKLPDKWVDKMNPPLHMLLVLQRDLKSKIAQITKGELPKNPRHPSIFHQVLESDMPAAEKSVTRLGEEAQTVLAAGLETTGWALSTACFHIINDHRVFQKLRAELRTALPDDDAQGPLDWAQLERLPYLGACIQEAMRLSYGVTARNPRISPHRPTRYRGWVIPAGTPVSMTVVDVHHDERIFPDSRAYVPERWLGDPRAHNGARLGRYFVAFGRGSRSCLGINLAHAELYLALAAVFRRFTFELYDTDITDVELAHDFFLPSPKLDPKGFRVIVRSIDD